MKSTSPALDVSKKMEYIVGVLPVFVTYTLVKGVSIRVTLIGTVWFVGESAPSMKGPTLTVTGMISIRRPVLLSSILTLISCKVKASANGSVFTFIWKSAMCSLPDIGWFPTSESNPKMVSDEAVVVFTETTHSSGKSSRTDKR